MQDTIQVKNKVVKINLLILPNEVMSVPLGRDFLSKFKIALSQPKLMYSKEKVDSNKGSYAEKNKLTVVFL